MRCALCHKPMDKATYTDALGSKFGPKCGAKLGLAPMREPAEIRYQRKKINSYPTQPNEAQIALFEELIA